MSYRFFLYVSMLFGLLMNTASALAEPTVSESYSFYFFNPNNSADLSAALDRSSPVRIAGKTYYGRADWNVHWDLKWTESKTLCTVTGVKTSLMVNYIMPRLQPAIRSDKQLLPKFQRFYDALLLHEKGHTENGVNAAREIETVLMGMEAPDCDLITGLANSRAVPIIRNYSARDVEYDRETQHGRTQGAVIQ